MQSENLLIVKWQRYIFFKQLDLKKALFETVKSINLTKLSCYIYMRTLLTLDVIFAPACDNFKPH